MKQYTLKINENDLKAISDGLNLLPLGQALTTFTKLDSQIVSQNEALSKPKNAKST